MMRVMLLITLVLAPAASVRAHPLGNNTVNRQSAIVVSPSGISLDYRLDLAEIPTLAEGIAADADRNGETSAGEWEQWASARTEEVGRHLDLQVAGQKLALRAARTQWRLNPGEAGLSILSLHVQFWGSLNRPPGPASLRFEDTYETATAGWKEIRVAGQDGVVIETSTVPAQDRSQGLTHFSLPLGAYPLQELSARAELRIPEGSERPTFPGSTAREAASAQGAFQGGAAREAWSFFRLGVHHIAVGFDHLAFLLGLLLLSPSLGRLAKVVTAFTLAHSLTLGLAANGWVAVPGAVIEPAIALSIAYVGALGAWGWRREHGVWLAFGFGLVHGFGFAGALADTLGTRADGGHWLVDLACFNLGIEALQLLLVSLAFPLLRFCGRFPWGPGVETAVSLAVMAAGTGWFALRVAGV